MRSDKIQGLFAQKNNKLCIGILPEVAEHFFFKVWPNRLYLERFMEESTQQNTESRAYKFKELKVYASTEWLADNKKKYRQVYDRNEASYVYAELSFFNKFFDIENWDVEISLRCLSMKRSGKEMCRLQIQRNISKY